MNGGCEVVRSKRNFFDLKDERSVYQYFFIQCLLPGCQPVAARANFYLYGLLFLFLDPKIELVDFPFAVVVSLTLIMPTSRSEVSLPKALEVGCGTNRKY